LKEQNKSSKMNNKEIQELINLVSKSNVAEVKIKDGEFSILIRSKDFFTAKSVVVNAPAPQYQAPQAVLAEAPKPASLAASPTAAQAPLADASAASNLVEIKSPMVGTFYRSAGPDKAAFVQVGDSIGKGQQICIIEAMKLFNEIESDIKGKIMKVLVDDATPVEYDQPLFLVDPQG